MFAHQQLNAGLKQLRRAFVGKTKRGELPGNPFNTSVGDPELISHQGDHPRIHPVLRLAESPGEGDGSSALEASPGLIGHQVLIAAIHFQAGRARSCGT